MIPRSIGRAEVVAALDEIDWAGVPAGRESRKFHLVRDGKKYPPKYVVSLAHKLGSGQPLASAVFSGGPETNDFLQRLGFSVISAAPSIPIPIPPALPRPPAIQEEPQPQRIVVDNHSERCRACKATIKELLRSLYGRVESNAQIKSHTRPDRSGDTIALVLFTIYEKLRRGRGFESLVRAESLPRSDYFVPVPGFVVEFDESQHFTQARKMALSLYPDDLPIGFERQKWMRLCDEIDAHDNDPPFRDEQRAWYDTLRDFLPLTQRMLPTLRLYSDEFQWCSLNPANQPDIETFRQILGERANFWSIDLPKNIPTEPLLARIVIDGHWRGDLKLARELLWDVCAAWRRGSRVLCLSTCGAFLTFDWPRDVPHQASNFSPALSAIQQMDAAARRVCIDLLAGGLREELAKRWQFLTIGIDTRKSKISWTGNRIPDDHAELVYVVELTTGRMHFTGKSYPTADQERGLLRVTDLSSHFLEMAGQSVMVLGCHDLTMFNPRGNANAERGGGWRSSVIREFRAICEAKQPQIVLHHPHTTVKRGTWQHAWSNLTRTLPSVQNYLGTGCYSYKDDWDARDPLDQVLANTKSSDVADVVIRLAGAGL